MTNQQLKKVLDGNMKAIRKNLVDKALYGFYNGYFVIIEIRPAGNSIMINTSSVNDHKNQELLAFFQQQRIHDENIIAVEKFARSIVFHMKQVLTLSDSINQMNTYVTLFTNILKKNGYVTGCACCGTNATTSYTPHQFDESGEFNYVAICDTCAPIIKSKFQERKEAQLAFAPKSNPLLGTFGAILGSLVGCLGWIIFYRFGKIAALSGVLGTRFAARGYKFFAKCCDIKGLLISFLVSMIMILLTHSGYWTWNLYNLGFVSHTVPVYETFFNLIPLLKEHGHFGAYWGDALIGCILIVVSLFPEMKRAIRKANGDFIFKKRK